jgi:hypothetical protein
MIACITVWHNCGSIKDKEFTESKKQIRKEMEVLIAVSLQFAQFGPLGAKCLP